VENQGASRRSFLAGSATGLGSAWVALNWSGILEAQEHAKQMAASGQPGKFAFFSADQATEVESVTAQILPTDETPGAREAGSVYFIDRALTTFDKDRQSVYKQGLVSLQAKVSQLFPGASKFSALTSTQQIQVLKAIESTPFFTAVRANPAYQTSASSSNPEGIVGITLAYRISTRWVARVSWDRITTRDDNDSDIVLAGFGYQF